MMREKKVLDIVDPATGEKVVFSALQGNQSPAYEPVSSVYQPPISDANDENNDFGAQHGAVANCGNVNSSGQCAIKTTVAHNSTVNAVRPVLGDGLQDPTLTKTFAEFYDQGIYNPATNFGLCVYPRQFMELLSHKPESTREPHNLDNSSITLLGIVRRNQPEEGIANNHNTALKTVNSDKIFAQPCTLVSRQNSRQTNAPQKNNGIFQCTPQAPQQPRCELKEKIKQRILCHSLDADSSEPSKQAELHQNLCEKEKVIKELRDLNINYEVVIEKHQNWAYEKLHQRATNALRTWLSQIDSIVAEIDELPLLGSSENIRLNSLKTQCARMHEDFLLHLTNLSALENVETGLMNGGFSETDGTSALPGFEFSNREAVFYNIAQSLPEPSITVGGFTTTLLNKNNSALINCQIPEKSPQSTDMEAYGCTVSPYEQCSLVNLIPVPNGVDYDERNSVLPEYDCMVKPPLEMTAVSNSLDINSHCDDTGNATVIADASNIFYAQNHQVESPCPGTTEVLVEKSGSVSYVSSAVLTSGHDKVAKVISKVLEKAQDNEVCTNSQEVRETLKELRANGDLKAIKSLHDLINLVYDSLLKKNSRF